MQRERIGESSSLSSIGYSADTAVLELEFKSGKVYQYFAVPAVVHAQLMKAESRGGFFNESIKGVYPFSCI